MSLLRKIYQTSPQQVYRFFANKKREGRTKVLVADYIKKHEVRKLHIGCGGNIFQSWLNSDLIPYSSSIAKIDASKPFPIPSSSFNYVYSEHVIEHLTIKEQTNFLNEALRILKPAGRIRIATPDFGFLANLANGGKTEFDKEYLRWNQQNFLKHVPGELIDETNRQVYVINNYFRDWGHQFIHSKSSLQKLMEGCGFQNLSFEEVGHSKDPALEDLERHGLMITEIYNKYETMIVEAEKPASIN